MIFPCSNHEKVLPGEAWRGGEACRVQFKEEETHDEYIIKYIAGVLRLCCTSLFALGF